MSDLDPEELARTVTIAGADGPRPAEVEALNGDIGPVWLLASGEIAFQAHRTEVPRPLDQPRPPPTAPAGAGWRPAATRPGPPDGRRLAFIDNSNRLITMTRDGKRKRRVRGSGVRGRRSVVAEGGHAGLPVRRAEPYGGRPRDLRLETVRANGTRLCVLVRESGSSLLSGRPDLDAERQAHPRHSRVSLIRVRRSR